MALREAIPTILVSGVVEKEKNKAEEKKKQTEVKAKKVQIEEDKKANKEALETFSKEFVSLTANDTFDALTDNVKGFSSFSPMKSIQFRSLKFFLKNALVPLF